MTGGTTIGHIHLQIGDLERAADFYHRALGLDKVVWSYPGALFLSAGGYHHHVGLNTWARSHEPPGDDDARLLQWELVLPEPVDVRNAIARLRRAGFEVEEAAGDGHARDPWGTAIRIRAQEH